MKCFYHDDLDGVCSAFWVWYSVGATVRKDSSFYRMNYGMPFPPCEIEDSETVFIVDYSIEPEQMRQLMWTTRGHVVWIDHHKTAIEKYLDFDLEIPGIRKEGKEAGCLLTFNYMNPTDPWRRVPSVPEFTKLISDWDTWGFEYGDATRAFHTAMTAEDLKPNSDLWMRLFDPAVTQQYVDVGAGMLKFRDGWAKSYMGLGFETELDGHKAFAVNLGRCNSEYFKSLVQGPDAQGYDILIPFVWDGDKWIVSLYSDSGVDVSEIAKKYGGGGHPGASGFQCQELPFDKKYLQ